MRDAGAMLMPRRARNKIHELAPADCAVVRVLDRLVKHRS